LARRREGTEFPVEICLRPIEHADPILITAAILDVSGRLKFGM